MFGREAYIMYCPTNAPLYILVHTHKIYTSSLWKFVLHTITHHAGTQVDEAKKLLRDSGLPIQPAANLSEAAEKAVNCLN